MKTLHSVVRSALWIALGAAFVPTVGWSAEEAPAADAAPAAPWSGSMEADLARTLKEQSDFYRFKTPADFATDTAGLKWDDASELEEFADPKAKKGGTLTLWLGDYPGTFRVIGPSANSAFRPYLLDNMMMELMRVHPNYPGKLYPELATAWAVDAAKKTVYLKLDPAARWSDGKPITTDDVVFTWYYMRSPHLNEPWYNDFYSKNYAGLIVYDKHSFALVFPELKPDIVSRSGEHGILPKQFFADFGPGWVTRYDWRIMPTSGPYTFTEADVKKGRSITMNRIKDWWGKDKRFLRGRYNPDRLRFSVIRDPDKALEAFTAGELDISPVGQLNQSKYWYDRMPDDHKDVAAGYIVKAKFLNRIPRPDYGLWINRTKPLVDNRDIREGLHYASDIDAICKQFYRGDAVPLETRSDGYGWRTHPTIGPRHYDPAKAREFFAKAGFTKQGPDGVLVDDKGRRLSLTITVYSRRLVDQLTILKESALKAGVEYNLDVLDETTGWKKMQEKQHEIAISALNRSVEMYPRYWEMYHGSNAFEDAYFDAKGQPVVKYSLGKANPNPQKIRTNTNNITETFIPELDRLIEEYDAAQTMDQIKTLAAQIEQIIYDDAAWVNGWKTPFFRLAYWRWVKWPEKFNAMQARNHEEWWLMWIDTDAEKETREARKAGKTFPPEVKTYDAYKE